jgi:GntR family transcriptional regulator, rspAB operon transcriptional repressor
MAEPRAGTSGGRRARGPRPDDLPALEPRVLLKDVAYGRLKDMIVRGEFEPGRFLSERRLAAQLDMSKTPIRSAVERLANEGLLLVSPQQGIVVAEVSFAEIIDLFEIRTALESFVVTQLAGTLTPERARRLSANLESQLAAAQSGDVVENMRLDTDFHFLLCEFQGNREITRVMWRLRDRLARIIVGVLRQRPQRMLESVHEHRAVVEAIVAGDGGRAAEAMRAHLAWGQRFLTSR